MLWIVMDYWCFESNKYLLLLLQSVVYVDEFVYVVVTSLRSFTNSTSWSLRSGLFSSVQSLCVNVFTSLPRHTSSTNSVRWRTLRLVSDFVPPRLHHWLSAVLHCPPSVTRPFRSLLLNTSPPHPLWLSSRPILILICSPSRITPLSSYSNHAVTLLLWTL